MSLIEEALRKTQQQQSASSPSDRPATEPGNPAKLGGRGSPVAEGGGTPLPTLRSPENPRARIERALMIGGAVLIAGVVAWEAWVYLTPNRQVTPRIARNASARSAQVVQTSLTPAVRRPLLQPTLRLSGIVGGPGEPLAIINGAIVRVGEEVAGATLLEIGQDFARVRWRDQDMILRTGE